MRRASISKHSASHSEGTGTSTILGERTSRYSWLMHAERIGFGGIAGSDSSCPKWAYRATSWTPKASRIRGTSSCPSIGKRFPFRILGLWAVMPYFLICSLNHFLTHSIQHRYRGMHIRLFKFCSPFAPSLCFLQVMVKQKDLDHPERGHKSYDWDSAAHLAGLQGHPHPPRTRGWLPELRWGEMIGVVLAADYPSSPDVVRCVLRGEALHPRNLHRESLPSRFCKSIDFSMF